MDLDFDIEKEKITMVKDGKDVQCDILFVFDSEDTNKAYVGYTDHSFAANGRKNIYVSAFDPILGLGELEDITDQKELDMVRDVLKEIDESSK